MQNQVNLPAVGRPQTLKGFRDFLPKIMIIRNYVKNLFIEVFESFGFEPVETPALEYSSTLMGKYGEEADKLVYSFNDQGGREVGMRYDLTVPVSKVLAIYNNQLPLPFKRYQIQPVWRAEKPQKGRYREVMQCDIDTFGSASPASDAEIIAVIYQILKKLNFSKFSIRINSRQVLYDLLSQSGIETNQNSVLQSIDKLNKIQEEGVRKELSSKGLDPSKIDQIFSQIKDIKPDQYLSAVFKQIELLGVPNNCFSFDPTMVRGLDYYTGPIFETYVEEPRIGSITGGGRYDKLIKTLGGPDIPATGTTIGLDRIVDCITELNLLPGLNKTIAKIMIANLNQEEQSLKLANFLRQNNINTFYYPAPEKLGKQLSFASAKEIPYVAIIGEDEARENKVTLKNMSSGEQKLIDLNEIVSQLI